MQLAQLDGLVVVLEDHDWCAVCWNGERPWLHALREWRVLQMQYTRYWRAFAVRAAVVSG